MYGPPRSRRATMNAASSQVTGRSRNAEPARCRSCRTMSLDGGGDRFDRVERFELRLVELDAIAVFEREHDFHVLQRVPFRRRGALARMRRFRQAEDLAD